MRRRVSPRVSLVSLALVVGLTSCAAVARDYREDGQAFLTSDEVFGAYGVNFTDPVCQEPASTKVGETFTCTANGDDGLVYDFTLQVTGRNKMSLVSIAPVYPPPTSRPSTTTTTVRATTTTARAAPTTTAARPTTTVARSTTTAGPTTTVATRPTTTTTTAG